MKYLVAGVVLVAQTLSLTEKSQAHEVVQKEDTRSSSCSDDSECPENWYCSPVHKACCQQQ